MRFESAWDHLKAMVFAGCHGRGRFEPMEPEAFRLWLLAALPEAYDHLTRELAHTPPAAVLKSARHLLGVELEDREAAWLLQVLEHLKGYARRTGDPW